MPTPLCPLTVVVAVGAGQRGSFSDGEASTFRDCLNLGEALHTWPLPSPGAPCSSKSLFSTILCDRVPEINEGRVKRKGLGWEWLSGTILLDPILLHFCAMCEEEETK
jgi:hypothetical protein